MRRPLAISAILGIGSRRERRRAAAKGPTRLRDDDNAAPLPAESQGSKRNLATPANRCLRVDGTSTTSPGGSVVIVCRCRPFDVSFLEELEEPAGPNHLGAQGLSSPTQLAIRCDERERLIRCVGQELNERVVTATVRVKHNDAAGEATRCSIAGLPF
jgi:hypothetical protein